VPEGYVCLDDGCSGMTLERPGLQRLRGLIRTRVVQAVIVLDLARLSRTLTHLFLLADECTQAEVAVHVVQLPSMSMCEAFGVLRHEAEADGGERGVTR
jgi:DNA invertase Pin-like site-specific DNA recombinase